MTYEIGSQWKTRGGWRAIVVGTVNDALRVWHDTQTVTKGELSINCKKTGEHKERADLKSPSDKCDLIEPWKEPRSGEIDCHVIAYPDGEISIVDHDDCCTEGIVIAKVTVKFTEGEGL